MWEKEITEKWSKIKNQEIVGSRKFGEEGTRKSLKYSPLCLVIDLIFLMTIFTGRTEAPLLRIRYWNDIWCWLLHSYRNNSRLDTHPQNGPRVLAPPPIETRPPCINYTEHYAWQILYLHCLYTINTVAIKYEWLYTDFLLAHLALPNQRSQSIQSHVI